MPQWTNSTRRDRLPDNWAALRKRVLRRDNGQCQVRRRDGKVCRAKANEVDHIVAGDNHDESNLRAICSWHHQRKSSGEGAAAVNARRSDIRKRFKRTEEHPGSL